MYDRHPRFIPLSPNHKFAAPSIESDLIHFMNLFRYRRPRSEDVRSRCIRNPQYIQRRKSKG